MWNIDDVTVERPATTAAAAGDNATEHLSVMCSPIVEFLLFSRLVIFGGLRKK